MRVVLSTFGGRGDVEPLVALASRLRELGVEVRACAPPDEDFVARFAAVGVELVPVGPSARELTVAAPRPSSIPEAAAQIVANQIDALPAAAEGCDVMVATGAMPAAAGALSVAERLGIRSVSVTFQQLTVPSPHRPPLAYPGRPLPPEVTDNRVLWDLDAENVNALFGEALNTNRASIGLPPVHNVRDYVVGRQPWLATDPVLDPWQGMADLDVVQTGAWMLPDPSPLPDELVAFLDGGPPPVYVGFGSMPMHTSTDLARVVIEAVRAQGRRAVVMRGWADLSLIDEQDDFFVVGGVNHHALFRRVAAIVHHGGAGTTTRAAAAGAPQVVVPQAADQPYWAGRVAELGIGVAHDGPTPTFESLSAALEDGPEPRDPRTGDRRGRHDPHRRRDGGRGAAGRRRQPREVAGVRREPTAQASAAERRPRRAARPGSLRDGGPRAPRPTTAHRIAATRYPGSCAGTPPPSKASMAVRRWSPAPCSTGVAVPGVAARPAPGPRRGRGCPRGHRGGSRAAAGGTTWPPGKTRSPANSVRRPSACSARNERWPSAWPGSVDRGHAHAAEVEATSRAPGPPPRRPRAAGPGVEAALLRDREAGALVVARAQTLGRPGMREHAQPAAGEGRGAAAVVEMQVRDEHGVDARRWRERRRGRRRRRSAATAARRAAPTRCSPTRR